MHFNFRYGEALRSVGAESVALVVEEICESLHQKCSYINFVPEILTLCLGLPRIVVAENYEYGGMELRLKFVNAIGNDGKIMSGRVAFFIGYGRRGAQAGMTHPHMPSRSSAMRTKMCISGTWYGIVTKAFDDKDWRVMFYESIAAASTYYGNDAYRAIDVPGVQAGEEGGYEASCYSCDYSMSAEDTYTAEDGTEWCEECTNYCRHCDDLLGADPISDSYGDSFCYTCSDNHLLQCGLCLDIKYDGSSTFSETSDGGLLCDSCSDIWCSECSTGLDPSNYRLDEIEEEHRCDECEEELEKEEANDIS